MTDELMRFTLIMRERQPVLLDRYAERVEPAAELSARVNQAAL